MANTYTRLFFRLRAEKAQSLSHIDAVVKYILNQPEHHKKQSFRDEYLLMLKKMKLITTKNICLNFTIRYDFRANAPPLFSGRFFYEDGRATPYSERKEFLGKGIRANAHHLCSGRLVVEIRNRFYTLSTRRQTSGMVIAVERANNLLLQHFGRCAREASSFPEKACAPPAL